VGERGDDVSSTMPQGDDADPNALHECATGVGEGVVGTATLQQLNEHVVTFAWVGAAPQPQQGGWRHRHRCGGGHCGAPDGVSAAAEATMWCGSSAALVSVVIAAEDVMSTMVVAAVSKAASFPPVVWRLQLGTRRSSSDQWRWLAHGATAQCRGSTCSVGIRQRPPWLTRWR
jgi:hypothetical protein